MGMPLNKEVSRVKLYTRARIEDVEDIKGAMNVGAVEITSDPPTWKEKVVKVTPDYSIIGPKFGKDTGNVAALLEKYAGDLEQTPQLEKDGFQLKREYIVSIQKEFYVGERRVEVLSAGDVVIEIEV